MSKNYFLRFRAVDRDKFEQMQAGIKSVETRAATTRYKDIKAGDTLTVACGPDRFKVEVTKSTHFDSVEELFKAYEIFRVFPDATTPEDALSRFHAFPDYEAKIKAHGIMAFELGPPN